MRKRPVIYLSGRITGKPNYKRDFAKAERFLRGKGFDVINPCKACEFDFFEYEDFMHVDFALIDIADAVFMLHDWVYSTGAHREQCYAMSLGKMVIYHIDNTTEQKLKELLERYSGGKEKVPPAEPPLVMPSKPDRKGK